MLGKSTRIIRLGAAALPLVLPLVLLLVLAGCKGGNRLSLDNSLLLDNSLSLGEEARRLNASLTRDEPTDNSVQNNNRLGGVRPRTLYDSVAVILARGERRRNKRLKKLLGKGALGKLPYETLAREAQSWGRISGAAFSRDEKQNRRENAWLALDMAQAYARINAKKKTAIQVADEQLLLEAVAGFWSQLNGQRFIPAIDATRRDLRNALGRSSLSDTERRNLTNLERQLFQNGVRLSARKVAFERGAGALLLRSKVYRRLQAGTLLPPPELLSITYTPELVDRVVAASVPPIRLGAKRADRILPPISSLAEALQTMPYLGLFAVPPREVRAFNNSADERLLLKLSYASAWGLIDLRYRRNNVEAQTYRQSRLLLIGVARMLSARIALLSYDRALQKFADALWRFQQQEQALLRSKPSSEDDPRRTAFLQTYSHHLLSAIEASESYAESLLWSLRLAFANNFLQAPRAQSVKTLRKLSQNADRIEARLRQTPGLLATPLEKSNTRLIFGLPPHRRNALDRVLEARIAIEANANIRAGTSPAALYSPQPSMLAPEQKTPQAQTPQIFEQGGSVYRRLPRPSQPQDNLPRLQKPSWLQNPTESPQ